MKLVVIDADVARASGQREATHLTAKTCRDALLALRDTPELGLAMSSELSEEWKRHQSKFARTWRVSMHARKRTSIVDAPPSHAPARKIVGRAQQKVQAILEKDLHLVDLAMATHGRVLSMDATARGCFVAEAAKTKKRCFALGNDTLHWASPKEEGVIAWIRRELPPDSRFVVEL